MNRNGFLIAGPLVVLMPAVVLAQERQGFNGFVSQTFEMGTNLARQQGNNNFGGRSLSTLGLGYLSETRTQTFVLDTEITGRGLSIENEVDDFLLTLPSAEVLYSVAHPTGFIELGAQFRETPIDILRPEAKFDEDGAFVGDDNFETVAGIGRRQLSGGSAEARFGEDRPIELGIKLGVRQIEYIDDRNTQDDTFRAEGGAEVLFRIAPQWTASIYSNVTYFEVEDGVDTQRELYKFGSGLSYAVNPNLTLSGEIGYEFDETRKTTGETQSDGMYATLGADYETALWQFALSGGIRKVNDEVLPIGQLTAERTLAQGSVGGYLGLDASDDADNVVTGGASFLYELAPASTIQAGLDRALTIGGDGEDQVRTSALLEFEYRLNARSDGLVGINYSLLEGLGNSDPDESFTEFNLGYEYALTRRADLTVGYSYQIKDNPPGDTAESHLLSVGVVVPFGL